MIPQISIENVTSVVTRLRLGANIQRCDGSGTDLPALISEWGERVTLPERGSSELDTCGWVLAVALHKHVLTIQLKGRHELRVNGIRPPRAPEYIAHVTGGAGRST